MTRLRHDPLAFFWAVAPLSLPLNPPPRLCRYLMLRS
jgi:hypothetical protein